MVMILEEWKKDLYSQGQTTSDSCRTKMTFIEVYNIHSLLFP